MGPDPSLTISCQLMLTLTAGVLCSHPKGHPPKPMPCEQKHQRKVGSPLSLSLEATHRAQSTLSVLSLNSGSAELVRIAILGMQAAKLVLKINIRIDILRRFSQWKGGYHFPIATQS